MSRPLDYDGSVKWEPLRNMSGETIPAFAVVGLSERAYYAGSSNGRDIVLQGYKPTAFHERLQDWRTMAFNGPEPIKAGGEGRCTRSWPARGLFKTPKQASDPDGVMLKSGYFCGCRAGSWYLHRTNAGFTYLGFDPAHFNLIQGSNSTSGTILGTNAIWKPNTEYVGWVQPRDVAYAPLFSFGRVWNWSTPTTIEAGDSLFTQLADGVNAANAYVLGNPDLTMIDVPKASGTGTEKAIEVGQDLTLYGHASAQVTYYRDMTIPPEDWEEILLGFRIYVQDGEEISPNDPENEEPTAFYTWHRDTTFGYWSLWWYYTNYWEWDWHGPDDWPTDQPLSMPFALRVRKGQRLVFRHVGNDAQYNGFSGWMTATYPAGINWTANWAGGSWGWYGAVE